MRIDSDCKGLNTISFLLDITYVTNIENCNNCNLIDQQSNSIITYH